MRRKQIRFFLAAAMLLLLAMVGYYFLVNLRAQRETARLVGKLAPDLVQDADQRMQNFHREKVQDGKKVWEIAARQARYSKKDGEVVIDDPSLSFYLDNGDVIALRCKEGRIAGTLEEQKVTRMELRGDLEMQLGDFFLKTQEAIYESERNVVSSPGSVQITGRGFTVEGQGYTVEVAEKRVTLNAGVSTTVSGKDG